MASKPDISTKVLLPWDEYKDKEPSAALASIDLYPVLAPLQIIHYHDGPVITMAYQ